MQRKLEWIFDWIFDALWRPKWMVWEAKIPSKINQKIIEILDAFLRPFLEWKRLETAGYAAGGVSPLGAWNSEFALA